MYWFYILAFVAVFLLRRRNPPAVRKYSVPFYPVVPLIAIFGSAFVLYSTLVNQFTDSLISIGVTLLGLPVYYFIQRRKKGVAR